MVHRRRRRKVVFKARQDLTSIISQQLDSFDISKTIGGKFDKELCKSASYKSVFTSKVNKHFEVTLFKVE